MLQFKESEELVKPVFKINSFEIFVDIKFCILTRMFI
jgi:hypothetical protein